MSFSLQTIYHISYIIYHISYIIYHISYIIYYIYSIYMYIYVCMYIYIYGHTHPPPMIHPSLLVNCSSTILCLRMLSPKSINHRYLRGFLLFTYTDLCLLCSFLVYVNHPKTQTRIWFCVRAETLEPFSVKTKETAVVFAQLVLFSAIRNPVSSRTMAGTQRALTICQYHKIESECFGEESGLPPANSKYIRWHVEVCRASYAL